MWLNVKVKIQYTVRFYPAPYLHGEPPFSIGSPVDFMYKNNEVRLLNIFKENLNIAFTRWVPNGEIWIAIWQKDDIYWAIMDDARIPENWRTKELNWFEYKFPNAEIVKEIYNFVGLEQFTVPIKMSHNML
jgi:hypothetical protein